MTGRPPSGRRRSRGRELHARQRTAARGVLERERGAVPLGDGLGDREAETQCPMGAITVLDEAGVELR